jgi:pimeloyl-ACP methyl ester carboxylesterase
VSTLAGTGGLSLERPPRFGVGRRLVAAAGVVALLLAWWQLRTATADVEVALVVAGDTPVTVLAPTGSGSPAPGVVVAHGFAGSSELMRAFALAFVDAGYAVALPDLAGHGRSSVPLGDPRAGDLADGVLSAADVLAARDDVDASRLVLVGHSMGSGAVLDAGLRGRADIAGVVAVSPTDAAVDGSAPPDLLLLAGSGEPRFVANAEDLLDRAGGAGGSPGSGDARAFEEIAGVEHVSILFSPEAHTAAVDWADAVTGRQSDPERAGAPSVLLWWAVGLVGVLAAWRAVVPLLRTSERLELRRGRPIVGLLLGSVVATLGSSAVDAILDLDAPGGMAVAPVLVVWFLLAGAVWLAVGTRPAPADVRDPVWAVLLLVVLVVGFGWLASSAWLPFVPISPPRRAAYVLPFLLALLPWTLAFATALQDRHGPRVFGWWLLVSTVLLLTLGATSSVVAGLGFLALVLPLLPLVLGLTVLVTHPVQRPWAAGLATAAFLAWLLAVLFPLT